MRSLMQGSDKLTVLQVEKDVAKCSLICCNFLLRNDCILKIKRGIFSHQRWLVRCRPEHRTSLNPADKKKSILPRGCVRLCRLLSSGLGFGNWRKLFAAKRLLSWRRVGGRRVGSCRDSRVRPYETQAQKGQKKGELGGRKECRRVQKNLRRGRSASARAQDKREVHLSQEGRWPHMQCTPSFAFGWNRRESTWIVMVGLDKIWCKLCSSATTRRVRGRVVERRGGKKGRKEGRKEVVI